METVTAVTCSTTHISTPDDDDMPETLTCSVTDDGQQDQTDKRFGDLASVSKPVDGVDQELCGHSDKLNRRVISAMNVWGVVRVDLRL